MTNHYEKRHTAANHVNMYAYLSDKGVTWQRYSHKEVANVDHDSMKANVRTGVVNWYSRNLSSFNNSVAFVQAVYPEMDQDAAVNSLLDFDNRQQGKVEEQTTTTSEKQPAFSMAHLAEYTNGTVLSVASKLTSQGNDYLRDKRFLNQETIDLFTKAGLLTSDNTGNIVFLWQRDQKTIGADIQSPRKMKLKRRIHLTRDGGFNLSRPNMKLIGANSAHDGSFTFSAMTDQAGFEAHHPIRLYVTEAPIEAMSLFELNQRAGRVENAFYQSMSGLKNQAIYSEIRHLRSEFPDYPLDVVMATNADKPGQAFIKKAVKEFEQTDGVNWKLLQPRFEGTDWNEMLEYQKTGQLGSRLEKQQDFAKAAKLVQSQFSSVDKATTIETTQAPQLSMHEE